MHARKRAARILQELKPAWTFFFALVDFRRFFLVYLSSIKIILSLLQIASSEKYTQPKIATLSELFINHFRVSSDNLLIPEYKAVDQSPINRNSLNRKDCTLGFLSPNRTGILSTRNVINSCCLLLHLRNRQVLLISYFTE